MSNEMRNQPSYQIDCECKGTGRITRYIGHSNRVAIFVCFACTDGENKMSNLNEMIERVAKAIVQTLQDRGYGQCADRNGRELAKAAIEAMKEPTQEIKRLTFGVVNKDFWTKLIEAALKDG